MSSSYKVVLSLALTISLAAPLFYSDQALAARQLLRAGSAPGAPAVPASVRAGGELRPLLFASGRIPLGRRPSHVGAGGRVFVFAEVPKEQVDRAFEAELLLWIDGRWQRRKTLHKEVGRVGYLGATIIDAELEDGPIATAVFARTAAAGANRWRATEPVDIGAAGGWLELGYTLDEDDWRGLAPVTVTVSAELLDGDLPTGRRVDLFERVIVADESQPRWYDARVDLAELAGQRVRFVFRAAPREAGSRLAPHVAWSVPVLRDGAPSSRPSVILVSLDGVRAASMSCCGETRAVTPFLDRLFGEQGIVFDRALAQSVETIPSHMTLLSGLYPSVHGVASAERGLGADAVTLAELLSRAGYATAAFTDGAGLAAELGFARGFDSYNEDFRLHLDNVEGWAAETFARARSWIERRRDEPFFVFIHTSQALSPFVPPRRYLDYFKDQRLDADGRTDEGALVRYERELRYLDDVMKQFVGELDSMVDPGRTFVVVTSSHGEEFLEHGAREAGAHLYDESIGVPLMMRGPGLRAARRYDTAVGLIDVAPTLLDLAGLNPPVEMQGRSIAKALEGGLPYSLPPRFSEAAGSVRLLAEGEDQNWRPPLYAVSDATHKLIMDSAGKESAAFEAYDLIADPQEASDLYSTGAAAPPWIAKLREMLENYPTACRQAARPTRKEPALPVPSRLKLGAYGYLSTTAAK